VEILARLDRTTGTRVMCGSIGNVCRGELARVQVIEKTLVASDGRTFAAGDRVLCMLDGWKQGPAVGAEPRHWVASEHSLGREAKATAAVRRGTLDRDVLASRRRSSFRQPIPAAKDTNHAVTGLKRDNYVIVSTPIPAQGKILADCPMCGRTNTLTAAKLRVAQR
jgi:hypothetical protein